MIPYGGPARPVSEESQPPADEVIEVLRETLAKFPDIEQAVIFTDWAAQYAVDPSKCAGDVWVMVVSPYCDDDLRPLEVYAGERLGVQVFLRRTPADVLKTMVTRPFVSLIGDVQPSPWPQPWPLGRDVVEAMIERGDLEVDPAVIEAADRMLFDARYALDDIEAEILRQPAYAYLRAYDAIHLAMRAFLAKQGLAVTAQGGERAAVDAVLAQIESHRDEPLAAGFRGAFKSHRRDLEVPSLSEQDAQTRAVRTVLADARTVLGVLYRITPSLGPFRQ